MTDPDVAALPAGDSIRTLYVRVESVDDFFDRIEAQLDEVESGAPADELTARGLSLPDESALARVFAVRNLELVRAIAEHDPSSMRELADVVDRDIKNVSQNLNELEQLGLVELVDDGRAKRPEVSYDEIEVVYPVRRRDDGPEDTRADA